MSRRIVVAGLTVTAAAIGMAIGASLVSAGETAGPKVTPFFEDFNAKQNGFAAFAVKPKESGNAKKNAGEYVFFTTALRSRQGGPVIGKNVSECRTTGFGIDLCRGVFFFNDRGSVTVDGYASSQTTAHVRTIPVVGGTGDFAGARGYIQSANQTDSGPGMRWKLVLVS
jgi:hypothetical protein